MCGAQVALAGAGLGLQAAGMVQQSNAANAAARSNQAAIDRQTALSRTEFDRRMAAVAGSDQRLGDLLRQGYDEQAAFEQQIYDSNRGLDREVYDEQRAINRELFDTTMAAELQAGRDAATAGTAAHDARMAAMTDQDRGRAAAWSRIGDILAREDDRRAQHAAASGEITASTIPLMGTAGFEAARAAAATGRADFANRVADAPAGAPVPVSDQMAGELAAAQADRVGDALTRAAAGSRLLSYGDAMRAGGDAMRDMDERLMIEGVRYDLGGAGVQNDLNVAGIDRGWADERAKYRFNSADVALGDALAQVGLMREGAIRPATLSAAGRASAMNSYGAAAGKALSDYGNGWGGSLGRYWGARTGAESGYINGLTGASSGYENTIANLTQSKINMTRPDNTLGNILGAIGSVAQMPTTQRWFDRQFAPSTPAPTYPSRTYDLFGGY